MTRTVHQDLGVFSVYDKKAEGYLSPFVFPAVGQAVRAFTNIVNDDRTDMYKWPEDFDLYQLGYMDVGSGQFTNDATFLIGGMSVAEPRPHKEQLSLIPEGDGNAVS